MFDYFTKLAERGELTEDNLTTREQFNIIIGSDGRSCKHARREGAGQIALLLGIWAATMLSIAHGSEIKEFLGVGESAEQTEGTKLSPSHPKP